MTFIDRLPSQNLRHVSCMLKNYEGTSLDSPGKFWWESSQFFNRYFGVSVDSMRLPVVLNVHPSRLTQRHLLEEEGFGFHTSSFLKARNQHHKLLAANSLSVGLRRWRTPKTSGYYMTFIATGKKYDLI